MSFAFKPADADWIEIGENGTELPGGGEFGESVVMSHAFVTSLPTETRAARGFVEVVESERPEGAIGQGVEDVDGVPTRLWIISED
jgi:hypothetical protein